MTKTQYLLICVMEECAEISQRASKALRFGLTEIQSGQERSNFERLVLELADLGVVLESLRDEKDVEPLDSEEFFDITKTYAARKLDRLNTFMEYSRSLGILECPTN